MAGIRTNLGKIRFRHKGTYSSTTAYAYNQIVNHDGCSYICINTSGSTGNAPPNATYWQLLADNSAAITAAASATAAATSATAAASGVNNAIAAQIAALTNTDASMAEVTDARVGAATVGARVRSLRNLWGYAPAATGKRYTTEYEAPATSMASIGTKFDDNVGLVFAASTDTERATNDYENIPLFRSTDANGYVDDSGEFNLTAVEGDGKFNRYGQNGDVWCLFQPLYFKIAFPFGKFRVSISDHIRAGETGWALEPGARRADGTARPFVAIAKYRAGYGTDNQLASISGVSPAAKDISHNTQITKMQQKGAGYCGETTKDRFHLSLLLWVAGGTLHSQGIMQGDTERSMQANAAIQETGVTRIVVSNANASQFFAGDLCIVGYGTTLSSGAINRDRYYCDNLVDRKKITTVEALPDGVNTAINIDCTAFDTTTRTVTINGTDYQSPVLISTIPRATGTTDTVLGQTGSPNSNTNGLWDCKLFGVENPWGSQYTVLADIIKQYPNVYVCDDCTKFATAVTADYAEVGYGLSAHIGWQYITMLGFDPNHPSVMLPVTVGASSTTRFGDQAYEDQVAGAREVLAGASLNYGSYAGLVCFDLNGGLGYGTWYIGSRLSATGKCGPQAT